MSLAPICFYISYRPSSCLGRTVDPKTGVEVVYIQPSPTCPSAAAFLPSLTLTSFKPKVFRAFHVSPFTSAAANFGRNHLFCPHTCARYFHLLYLFRFQVLPGRHRFADKNYFRIGAQQHHCICNGRLPIQDIVYPTSSSIFSHI